MGKRRINIDLSYILRFYISWGKCQRRKDFMKNIKIDANGTEIRVMGDVVNEEAYISLTDIAKYKNPDNAFIVVANWMQSVSSRNQVDKGNLCSYRHCV